MKKQKAKEYVKNITDLDYIGKVKVKKAYLFGWDEALNNQWVRIEDGLPKENEEVFVLFEHNGRIMINNDVYFGEYFYKIYHKDNI